MNSNEHSAPVKVANVTNEAEDEHFRLAESLIIWMEHYKTTQKDNPSETLSSILPQPSHNQKLYYTSSHVIGLNLVRNFGRRQNCDNLLASLDTSSYLLELNQRLDELSISRKVNTSQMDTSPSDASDETTRSQLIGSDDEIQAIVDEFTIKSGCQSDSTIESTVIHEEKLKTLLDDSVRSEVVVELLLGWLSSPRNYGDLTCSYYTANHLLKSLLDARSTSHQVDLYSSILVNVCLAHPQSVEIFSPYLSPSTCSAPCFLDLYKSICSNQVQLGPMATFVLLSKFDIKSWLATNSTEMKRGYHELVVTTCSAFKDIGRNPDKSYELTMDLLRRHLQAELAAPNQSMPDELLLVLGQFLNLMDEQTLAPDLWFDFLTILGSESQDYAKHDKDLKSESGKHSPASDRIWSSFLLWLARITQVLGSNRSSGHLMISGNASKLITAWLRMLVMLEHQLERLILASAPMSEFHDQHRSNQSRTASPVELLSDDSLVSSGEHDLERQSSAGKDLKPAWASSGIPIVGTLNASSPVSSLSDNHKCLLELIKQLISLYDSINSGGLWSYLKSSSGGGGSGGGGGGHTGGKSGQLVKVSITSLSIACFLATRALDCLIDSEPRGTLHGSTILREELSKLRRVSLLKLKAARKSRSFSDCGQFIDSLMASVQQSTRVQYGEVVQLITGFSLIESGQHPEDSSK